MKKFFWGFMVILAITVFSADVLAAEEEMENGVEYEEESLQLYTTSEENVFEDFVYKMIKNDTEIEITDYVGRLDEINIPEEINGLPVTVISGCYGLSASRVNLPMSLTTLNSAFNSCKNMIDIVIPENVNQIKTSFGVCDNLQYAYIVPHFIFFRGDSFTRVSPVFKIFCLNYSSAQNYAIERDITYKTICSYYYEDGRYKTEGHQYNADYTADYKATFYEDGAKSIRCQKCGDKKDTVILPKLKAFSLDEGIAYPYMGRPMQIHISVRSGTHVLSNPEEYTRTYRNNINAGTAYIDIDVNSEFYEGSTTYSFKIAPKEIKDLAIAPIKDQAFKNKPINPEIDIRLKDDYIDLPLENGKDFDLSLSDNTNVGTATAKIIGKGNYTGFKYVNFNIVPSKNGWINENSKWYYYNYDDMVTNQWIDGYYLKDNGVMASNEFIIDRGVMYYILDSGKKYNGSGWKKIDNKWYYFQSGLVVTGWLNLSGKWYYLDSGNGTMKTGWYLVNNIWYFSDGNGIMKTGWNKIGGVWYYLDNSGAMKTGWFKQSNIWYYLNKNGAMVKGWNLIDNTWYYFNGSGYMLTGWQYIGSKWYYLNSSGAMVTGWLKLGGNWYYLTSSGQMLTGWQKINAVWYYFNSSGHMYANTWIGDYYLTSNGAMATNMWVGKYYVGSDGKWTH